MVQPFLVSRSFESPSDRGVQAVDQPDRRGVLLVQPTLAFLAASARSFDSDPTGESGDVVAE